jgi:hypothetical protein
VNQQLKAISSMCQSWSLHAKKERPDPEIPAQRLIFGTSGRRGSSFTRTFNQVARLGRQDPH